MAKKEKSIIRKGVVVSDRMDKTIVVAVNAIKTHSKYRKKYKSTKRYKVDDPENKYKLGDTVEFIECKPVSKNKRFTMVS